MYGAIIGDIVGSVYEFRTIKQKEFKFFKDRCFFTDDTVMTCAIALACIKYKETKNLEEFKKVAESEMRRLGNKYPDAGYGYRFFDWLQDEKMGPYNSYANGGAMRTAPVAYVADTLEEALTLAEAQCSITHNHPDGIKGAKAIAACIFLARNGATKEDIRKYIEDNFYQLDFTIPAIHRKYKYDISAAGSVPQAIESFLEGTDFEDSIRNAICLGGDADTLACMTGSIAESFFGIPEEIKERALSFLDPEVKTCLEKFNQSVNISENNNKAL